MSHIIWASQQGKDIAKINSISAASMYALRDSGFSLVAAFDCDDPLIGYGHNGYTRQQEVDPAMAYQAVLQSFAWAESLLSYCMQRADKLEFIASSKSISSFSELVKQFSQNRIDENCPFLNIFRRWERQRCVLEQDEFVAMFELAEVKLEHGVYEGLEPECLKRAMSWAEAVAEFCWRVYRHSGKEQALVVFEWC